MSPPSAYAASAPAGAANPRWDKSFVDRCLVDLMQHFGQYRRLGILYAADAPSFERCTAVRDAVEAGRRVGMQIESSRGKGYRLVGFRHPVRIWTVKPGPTPVEEVREVPGQMVLVEV